MRTYHRTAPTDPRPTPTLRVLNLGAGTQSTAVALMSAEGMIPRYDAAIFADTGWEPRAVYDHLERLIPALEDAGIPTYTVSAGNIRDDALDDDHGFASMPLFVSKIDGGNGMARRQCTREYKIAPVRRKILELLGERLEIDAPTFRSIPRDVFVEQSFGISVDEVVRAKSPRDRWEINYYPLLEQRYRRGDTIAWLERRGWHAPRSACIGCPFRSDDEWRNLPAAEFDDAVEFDTAIREDGRSMEDGALVYLHSSRLPLAEVDLTTPEDAGQLALGECEGVCWT